MSDTVTTPAEFRSRFALEMMRGHVAAAAFERAEAVAEFDTSSLRLDWDRFSIKSRPCHATGNLERRDDRPSAWCPFCEESIEHVEGCEHFAHEARLADALVFYFIGG